MNWEDIHTPAEWADIALAEATEAREERITKEHWKRVLKPLINTHVLWRWLDDHDSWAPHGIFQLQIVTKRNGYYNRDMPHGKIVGEDYPEMHHQKESTREIAANHMFIYQTSSYPCEDCYSGFIAIPLSNRKYFLISFSC